MSSPPEHIAGYRIVRTLGRGGMGTVYLAEQDQPVARRVALKVLRNAVSDDESSARFLAERHAMGRLDHPNVGRILEAGEDEAGRPFFAMEWLDGLPLEDYCREHQLSIRERLRLFLGICRGVAHAHQKQLLHRDLKPSNVLVIDVDGEPVAKVIDFGVAKALDQPLGGVDLKTQHVLGTPVYTSPEGLHLHEVDLDTRSDVYSLGVLLCELLVGRRPHELGDGALGSFLRRKAEEDPTSPSGLVSEIPGDELEKIATARRQGASELRKAMRGDLDWIVLKAVARKRSDRYASVSELAADVERHLNSEPILARPPSLGYLVGKFVRRHRAAVVFAGTLLLAFLVGVAGLAVGLRRARAAEAQSRADAEAARRAQSQAEAVSTFLSGLFLEANPLSSRIGERTNPAELSARELVDRGGERAIEELADEPRALLRVQSLLGDIYDDWGRLDEARQRHEMALAMARQIGLPSLEEAAILVDLGRTEYQLQDFSAADSHLRSALDRVRSTAADETSSVRRHQVEVRALVSLGQLARAQGDFEMAGDFLRQAQDIDRNTPDLPTETRLPIYTSLTSLALSQGRPEDAELPVRIAYDLSRRDLPDTHPRRANVTNSFAVVLAMQDKLDEAVPMFRETLELRTKLFGRRHPTVAEALNNLGAGLLDLRRPEDALPVHLEALDIRRETLGDDDLYTAWSHDNVGVALLDLARYDEALEHHRRAFEIRQKALAPDHPDVARSLYFLGRLEDALGNDRAAEPFYRRSIEIRDAEFPPEHTGNAEGRVRLGALLLRRGQVDEAETLIRDGLAVLRAAEDSDLPELLELLRAAGFEPG